MATGDKRFIFTLVWLLTVVRNNGANTRFMQARLYRMAVTVVPCIAGVEKCSATRLRICLRNVEHFGFYFVSLRKKIQLLA